MIIGFSAVALYQSLDQIVPRREEIYAKNKLFQKDLEYFKEQVKKIETTDEFFKDYKLLKIALTAYGLESEIDKLGYVKKILTSNPFDDESLVNRVADNRYRDMAADLLLSSGIGVLRTEAFADKISEKLISVGVEKELDEQSPGIRAAIQFKQAADAGQITGPFNILANSVFREVAIGASGLPQQIVFSEIESQGRTLERFFDFDRFDNPKYVDNVIKRYLVNADIQNANSANPAASILSLFGNSSSTSGFDLSSINLLV